MTAQLAGSAGCGVFKGVVKAKSKPRATLLTSSARPYAPLEGGGVCRPDAEATSGITARAVLIKTAVTWENLAKQFEKLWPEVSEPALKSRRLNRRARRS
jgi:hypothetical protein